MDRLRARGPVRPLKRGGVQAAAAELTGNYSKHFKDFHLKAKERIWP